MGPHHVQSSRNCLRIDAGAKPECFQAPDQALRGEIAGCSRSERATAEAASSRVKGADPMVEGFFDTCQRRSGRVVDVQRQPIKWDRRPRRPQRFSYRSWRSDPDRVGQANLIATKLEQARGDVKGGFGLDGPGIRTPEGNRDVAPNPDAPLPSPGNYRLETLERFVD
jgi:hypothetical protein